VRLRGHRMHFGERRAGDPLDVAGAVPGQLIDGPGADLGLRPRKVQPGVAESFR
jgi:hypothetical protein